MSTLVVLKQLPDFTSLFSLSDEQLKATITHIPNNNVKSFFIVFIDFTVLQIYESSCINANKTSTHSTFYG